MDKIEQFLFELRSSAEDIYKIFTSGSCFRLYSILKCFYPKIEAYWSDIDNHTIVKINKEFYDIGGKLSKEYISDKGYYKINENLLDGYYLLVYPSESRKVYVEKYKRNV